MWIAPHNINSICDKCDKKKQQNVSNYVGGEWKIIMNWYTHTHAHSAIRSKKFSEMLSLFLCVRAKVTTIIKCFCTMSIKYTTDPTW